MASNGGKPMRLTDFSLIALQTAFMQRDRTTQEICNSVQPELESVVESTYNILMYQMLSTAEDTPFANQLIDELAWQFHVDYYDKSASFDVKKGLVKNAIRIHQKKGTPRAVEELIGTAFTSTTQLLEWFNYDGGEPYHFKIRTAKAPADEDFTKFIRALNTVKNERSFLDAVEQLAVIENNAVGRTINNRTITYKTKVGLFNAYTFQDGDELSFGVGEEAYSFIDKEVD